MKKEVVILLAEDDDGHAALIQRNLQRAGIANEIIRFQDGRELLNFLFREGPEPHRKSHTPYLLLLDIRMPKVDGIEALKQIKSDKALRRIPVIMLTTMDDPNEVTNCHELGCNNYVVKPVNPESFIDSIRQLGLFLLVVEAPLLNGD